MTDYMSWLEYVATDYKTHFHALGKQHTFHTRYISASAPLSVTNLSTKPTLSRKKGVS